MNTPSVLFEELSGTKGNLGIITLNRPHALNALTHEMILLLEQKLSEWEKTNHIKAVVIRSAPGRAFCAGGDLRLAYEKYQAKDPLYLHFFRDEYRLNQHIHHYTKPYIAFCDGITMGGGVGISIHGSHRIGTEHLVLAMPETGIGFFPDVGGSYFLSRLPQDLGVYLGLTGIKVGSDDCLSMQLIHYTIPQNKLSLVLEQLAYTAFGDNPYDSVSQILTVLHQPVNSSSPRMMHRDLIQQHFTKSTIEAIMESLKNASHPWCQETAALLEKKSPTSLKVTLRALQEGAKRNFDQCMTMEYMLAQHFIQAHDFYEGIRALLIDKDQAPEWHPQTLSEVSQELVFSYFVP